LLSGTYQPVNIEYIIPSSNTLAIHRYIQTYWAI